MWFSLLVVVLNILLVQGKRGFQTFDISVYHRSLIHISFEYFIHRRGQQRFYGCRVTRDEGKNQPVKSIQKSYMILVVMETSLFKADMSNVYFVESRKKGSAALLPPRYPLRIDRQLAFLQSSPVQSNPILPSQRPGYNAQNGGNSFSHIVSAWLIVVNTKRRKFENFSKRSAIFGTLNWKRKESFATKQLTKLHGSRLLQTGVGDQLSNHVAHAEII